MHKAAPLVASGFDHSMVLEVSSSLGARLVNVFGHISLSWDGAH